MKILDLRVGCVTRLGMALNEVINNPRFKDLKDLAPLLIHHEEPSWFYPRFEIQWISETPILVWLDLFVETFPEVAEEVEIIRKGMSENPGKVIAYHLFEEADKSYLNKVWSSHEKSFTIYHPGGPHPYSK